MDSFFTITTKLSPAISNIILRLPFPYVTKNINNGSLHLYHQFQKQSSISSTKTINNSYVFRIQLLIFIISSLSLFTTCCQKLLRQKRRRKELITVDSENDQQKTSGITEIGSKAFISDTPTSSAGVRSLSKPSTSTSGGAGHNKNAIPKNSAALKTTTATSAIGSGTAAAVKQKQTKPSKPTSSDSHFSQTENKSDSGDDFGNGKQPSTSARTFSNPRADPPIVDSMSTNANLPSFSSSNMSTTNRMPTAESSNLEDSEDSKSSVVPFGVDNDASRKRVKSNHKEAEKKTPPAETTTTTKVTQTKKTKKNKAVHMPVGRTALAKMDVFRDTDLRDEEKELSMNTETIDDIIACSTASKTKSTSEEAQQHSTADSNKSDKTTQRSGTGTKIRRKESKSAKRSSRRTKKEKDAKDMKNKQKRNTKEPPSSQSSQNSSIKSLKSTCSTKSTSSEPRSKATDMEIIVADSSTLMDNTPPKTSRTTLATAVDVTAPVDATERNSGSGRMLVMELRKKPQKPSLIRQFFRKLSCNSKKPSNLANLRNDEPPPNKNVTDNDKKLTTSSQKSSQKTQSNLFSRKSEN